MAHPLNIADRLRTSARLVPYQRAVVFPETRDRFGRTAWTSLTFEQLDEEADRIARGLIRLGVQRRDRLVLMVRPSLEFIALTFGIFRSGAICTLIDPGMGRSRMFGCLDQVDPNGFLAVTPVHVLRRLMPWRFRSARCNVIVGPENRRLGCISYPELLQSGSDSSVELPVTDSTDPAAVIFTSGSTGPPKGVLYEHGMFDGQVELIRERFMQETGEADLPGFPLFALFNLAMQVTTVIPDMDPTRPADVDPVRIVSAMRDQHVTQAFGSPAMWNRIGRYCRKHKVKLPTIRRVLSAGAPVPDHVLERMLAALPEQSDLFTPYGATECLPVAVIGGREVLREKAEQTRAGAGTCVGRVFPGMEVRIIEATDDPLPDISDTTEMPQGEVGEIIVRGPVATREYFRNPEATAAAKIGDGSGFWHRMGDVGYIGDDGLLWFCGRKAHIVHSSQGPMYSVCCEALFNTHRDIYRCALVGVGPRGNQVPVIVAEPEAEFAGESQTLLRELRESAGESRLTAAISHFLLHPSLPVDTRHNVKINREELAAWASTRIT